MTTRRFPRRALPPVMLMLTALLAATLQGCTGRDEPAAAAIQPRAERAHRPSDAAAQRTDPLQRFIPLSELPTHTTLLALVLSDMMPAASVDGALPARIERARGDVPNMARPMAYWVTETLALAPDGRITAGTIEVVDETDISTEGYLQFAFQPDGRILVQGVVEVHAELAWPAVAALLPRRATGRPATTMHP